MGPTTGTTNYQANKPHTMSASDDLYEILGVGCEATVQEIKKAYRKLAIRHHPDKQETDEDRQRAQTIFSGISNAYETLCDEDLRRKYDRKRAKKMAKMKAEEEATSKGSEREFPEGQKNDIESHTKSNEESTEPEHTASHNGSTTQEEQPNPLVDPVEDHKLQQNPTENKQKESVSDRKESGVDADPCHPQTSNIPKESPSYPETAAAKEAHTGDSSQKQAPEQSSYDGSATQDLSTESKFDACGPGSEQNEREDPESIRDSVLNDPDASHVASPTHEASQIGNTNQDQPPMEGSASAEHTNESDDDADDSNKKGDDQDSVKEANLPEKTAEKAETVNHEQPDGSHSQTKSQDDGCGVANSEESATPTRKEEKDAQECNALDIDAAKENANLEKATQDSQERSCLGESVSDELKSGAILTASQTSLPGGVANQESANGLAEEAGSPSALQESSHHASKREENTSHAQSPPDMHSTATVQAIDNLAPESSEEHSPSEGMEADHHHHHHQAATHKQSPRSTCKAGTKEPHDFPGTSTSQRLRQPKEDDRENDLLPEGGMGEDAKRDDINDKPQSHPTSPSRNDSSTAGGNEQHSPESPGASWFGSKEVNNDASDEDDHSSASSDTVLTAEIPHPNPKQHKVGQTKQSHQPLGMGNDRTPTKPSKDVDTSEGKHKCENTASTSPQGDSKSPLSPINLKENTQTGNKQGGPNSPKEPSSPPQRIASTPMAQRPPPPMSPRTPKSRTSPEGASSPPQRQTSGPMPQRPPPPASPRTPRSRPANSVSQGPRARSPMPQRPPPPTNALPPPSSPMSHRPRSMSPAPQRARAPVQQRPVPATEKQLQGMPQRPPPTNNQRTPGGDQRTKGPQAPPPMSPGTPRQSQGGKPSKSPGQSRLLPGAGPINPQSTNDRSTPIRRMSLDNSSLEPGKPQQPAKQAVPRRPTLGHTGGHQHPVPPSPRKANIQQQANSSRAGGLPPQPVVQRPGGPRPGPGQPGPMSNRVQNGVRREPPPALTTANKAMQSKNGPGQAQQVGTAATTKKSIQHGNVPTSKPTQQGNVRTGPAAPPSSMSSKNNGRPVQARHPNPSPRQQRTGPAPENMQVRSAGDSKLITSSMNVPGSTLGSPASRGNAALQKPMPPKGAGPNRSFNGRTPPPPPPPPSKAPNLASQQQPKPPAGAVRGRAPVPSTPTARGRVSTVAQQNHNTRQQSPMRSGSPMRNPRLQVNNGGNHPPPSRAASPVREASPVRAASPVRPVRAASPVRAAPVRK